MSKLNVRQLDGAAGHARFRTTRKALRERCVNNRGIHLSQNSQLNCSGLLSGSLPHRSEKHRKRECKMGCGMTVAARSATGREFDTCCRGCAAFGKHYHLEGCNDNHSPTRLPWKLLKTHALGSGVGNEVVQSTRIVIVIACVF